MTITSFRKKWPLDARRTLDCLAGFKEVFLRFQPLDAEEAKLLAAIDPMAREIIDGVLAGKDGGS